MKLNVSADRPLATPLDTHRVKYMMRVWPVDTKQLIDKLL